MIGALWVGLLAASPVLTPAAGASIHADQSGKGADFRGAPASSDVQQVADWVLAVADNQGLPFIIVDKVNAKVFVFDAAGMLRGAAPVLLGFARGDVAPADIGTRRLATISTGERITPAGRFVTSAGVNLAQKEILWIDYESSLSLHSVITSNKIEKRAQRLESLSVLDNRISYGCINVPAEFFKTVVREAFRDTMGITYILPEDKLVHEVFDISREGHMNSRGR